MMEGQELDFDQTFVVRSAAVQLALQLPRVLNGELSLLVSAREIELYLLNG